MKKIILATAAAALVTMAAFANRSLELSSLENLEALDSNAQLAGTKAALTWVNEQALEHLPVAATLRTEDAVAGVMIRVTTPPVTMAYAGM